MVYTLSTSDESELRLESKDEFLEQLVDLLLKKCSDDPHAVVHVLNNPKKYITSSIVKSKGTDDDKTASTEKLAGLTNERNICIISEKDGIIVELEYF